MGNEDGLSNFFPIGFNLWNPIHDGNFRFRWFRYKRADNRQLGRFAFSFDCGIYYSYTFYFSFGSRKILIRKYYLRNLNDEEMNP